MGFFSMKEVAESRACNSIDPVYPPLEDVRKTLRIKWYRSPVSPKRLRGLSIRTDRQGWIQAGGHVGIYLCLAFVTTVLWLQEAWVGFVISWWCLGFVATFFKGTAAHELGHGIVLNKGVELVILTRVRAYVNLRQCAVVLGTH